MNLLGVLAARVAAAMAVPCRRGRAGNVEVYFGVGPQCVPRNAVKIAAYLVGALCAAGIGGRSLAAPTAIELFAARSRIEGVSISPDGHYLAIIRTAHGKGSVLVLDRTQHDASQAKTVLGEPDQFHFRWCRWATDTRLLCSYSAMDSVRGIYFGVTRLAAVDADGKNMKVLLQNEDQVQGQFQDRIINWDPGKADTVLVEVDEGLSSDHFGSDVVVYGNVGTHGAPGVFELNVVTGKLLLRQRAREPIRHWITDHRGQVRLGWAQSETTLSYYARLDQDRDWRRLSKFEIFSREVHFLPIAISSTDPNKAYAIGPSEGRDAVWLIDLTDKEDPTLVFAHPVVDVTDPLFAHDGTLLGAEYEDQYPSMYFTSDRQREIIESLKHVLPGKFNVVAGSTRDESVLIIRSVSDRDSPTYGVLETASSRFTRLGSPNPDLDSAGLAPLQPVSYPARDGTQIPGYLTLPRDSPKTQLPLIVMPHGGPISRDYWRYFFLREFLASRGYAVLQMNFRGSGGYGDDWFFAAHQDWGGLTYDDVVDGTRWAVQKGIADPKRICVVGWSFGGYIALLGAQRNPDLFQCAVSIAGIGDLNLLVDEGHHFLNAKAERKQIGTDSDKLKRDSPRKHAKEFQVPVLMLHGNHDAQVPYEQSKVMDSALTSAGKVHRFVTIDGADHQLSNESDRITMLREVEAFLAQYLVAPAVKAP